MTEMPWALRPAITSSSFSVSAIGRLEVGSSRMTRRDWRLSALAISTICCSASDSRATGVVGENVAPSRSRNGWTALLQLVVVDQLQKAVLPRFAPDIDVRRDGQIVEEIEFLVDEGDTGRHRLGNGQRRMRHAVDFDGAAVGVDHPAEDLHQGRLAGAVLSDEADDLARPDVHAEIGQRHDAGIGLAKPRQLEEGLG